jgi:hypothetical protein
MGYAPWGYVISGFCGDLLHHFLIAAVDLGDAQVFLEYIG